MRILLSALIVLMTTPTAWSQARPTRILRCFSRAYSVDHLGRNPLQTLHNVKYAMVTDQTGRPIVGYWKGFTPDPWQHWIQLTGSGRCTRVNGWSTTGQYKCAVEPNLGAYTISTNADGVRLVVTRDVMLDMQPGQPGERAILRVGPDDGVYYLYSVPLRECADIDL